MNRVAAINFTSLGYHVNPPRGPVSRAAQSAARATLNQYIYEGRLINRDRAKRLYARCEAVLFSLCEAAGIERSRVSLSIVEDAIPNCSIGKRCGDVFVTTALLEKENLTEGQLAAVLGHELGHYLKGFPPERLPRQFKNKMFREYALAGRMAAGQKEEYSGDELGLVIMDRAGYSVKEAENVFAWLAEQEGERAEDFQSSAPILSPASTHPQLGNRYEKIREIISSPIYKWLNLNRASKALLGAAEKAQMSKRELRAAKKHLRTMPPKFHSPDTEPDWIYLPLFREGEEHDLFSLEAFCYLAENWHLGERPVLFFMVCLDNKTRAEWNINDPVIRNRLRTALLALKQEAEQGNLAARDYHRALILKLYVEYTRACPRASERTRTLLDFLEQECGVSVEQIGFALFMVLNQLEQLNKGEVNENYLHSHFRPNDLLEQRTHRLKDLIQFLPPSKTRDRIILELLRWNNVLLDRHEYVANSNILLGPIRVNEKDFELSDFLKLGRLLVDPDNFEGLSDYVLEAAELGGALSKRERAAVPQAALRQAESADLFPTQPELDYFFYATCILGLPYYRAEVDRLLTSAAHFSKLDRGMDRSEDRYQLTFADAVENLFRVTADLESFYQKEPAIQKRVRSFMHLALLRFLEVIPAKTWSSEFVEQIRALPKSSEKNHLLFLLHEAKKISKPQKQDLLFEDIPRVDEMESSQEGLGLLNAFGFNSPFQSEALYPSGQRMLDSFMAEALPAQGTLEVEVILELIPRPSPKRDDLLLRCTAKDTESAKKLLEHFWSPAAAYTKAYQIASDIIAKSPGAEQDFAAVCEITTDFPSLRRRMVKDWTGKFGLNSQQYAHALASREQADVIDIFKGAVVETTKASGLTTRMAICLATFASALEREDFSLLTIKNQAPEKDDDSDSKVEEPYEEESQKVQEERIRQRMFDEYAPVLPENARKIADLLYGESHYALCRIPFVDEKPAASFRYNRFFVVKDALREMQRWESGKTLTFFMQAMGIEEAVVFFEELLLGKRKSLNLVETRLLHRMEEVFIPGIGLLLQEKGVPLSRVQIVEEGIKNLMEQVPSSARARMWARILAGIASRQEIGEILREAVKPLGIAGGKLTQIIYSAVAGVNSVLEKATRLALDQTDALSFLDALKFLGFRIADGPFSRFPIFKPLGQGTVRTAIAGMDGGDPLAFLMVHSRPTPQPIVRSLTSFLDAMTHSGHQLPIGAGQFEGLVREADLEALQGFARHREYGELHGWQLGELRIPRVIRDHGDWAEVELVRGVPFSALPVAEQAQAAPQIVTGAFAQFKRAASPGIFRINPETHPGNIIFSCDGIGHLIDCGLTGEVRESDFKILVGLLGAYRTYGLPGAVASLLISQGLTSVSDIRSSQFEILQSSIHNIARQIRAGIAPEFLLTSLSGALGRAKLFTETKGIGTLLRGMQHLAPYLRLLEEVPFEMLAGVAEEDAALASLSGQVQSLLKEQGPGEKRADLIPAGIEMGRETKEGIETIGISAQDAVLMTEENCEGNRIRIGMYRITLENLTLYIPPRYIRIRSGAGWITLAEWFGPQAGDLS